MRKIETQMNSAVSQSEDWRSGNTRVNHADDTAFVYLHNNLIAKINYHSIQLFDGGWQSNTTKSRLNALLSTFGKAGEKVFQKQHEWYFRNANGQVIDFNSGMLLQ